MTASRSRECNIPWTVLLTVIGVTALMEDPLTARAQKTYYIDESTDYTSNGCQNTDLNDVTSQLQGTLNSDSWTGSRFVNIDSWPADFVENCHAQYLPSGTGVMQGLDHIYADTKTFTVFAGHGNVGQLYWGYPHDNACGIDFSSNMRLGSMDGNESGVAWYLSSCTLNTSGFVSEANWQWLRQQAGFHNSPGIADNAPSWTYAITINTAYSNKNAWMLIMDQADDIYGSNDDTPVMISYGSSASDCLNTHNTARLRANILVSDRSGPPACRGNQPFFHYCWDWVNNGSGACP